MGVVVSVHHLYQRTIVKGEDIASELSSEFLLLNTDGNAVQDMQQPYARALSISFQENVDSMSTSEFGLFDGV